MAKYTIRQIADLTGISAASVSRILSGQAEKYRISKATVEKVLARTKELDFQPNYFAQALNTRRTWNIGMVFANTIDSFLGSIMEGAEREFRKTEYLMSVATCEDRLELERDALRRLKHRQVDGAILYPSAAPQPRKPLSEELGALPPCVVIGRDNGLNVDKFLFDDFNAGVAAARDFLRSGAKSFGMVSLPIHCASNRDRLEGFKQTLLNAGIPETRIVLVGASCEPWLEPLENLLEVDAIFGVNASTLVRTVLKLSTLRKVDDLGLWTFGSVGFASELRFRFKSFSMPSNEMGRLAARRLLDRIENPSLPVETVRLPWPEEKNS